MTRPELGPLYSADCETPSSVPRSRATVLVWALGRKGNGMLERQPLLRTTFGDVLRRIRLEQGRTLADVARAARVSMPYLSELERGRKEASSEVLAAICAALDIDLSDLLAEARRELVQAASPA